MNSFELSQTTLPELLNMLSSIILFVDRSFIFRLNSLLPINPLHMQLKNDQEGEIPDIENILYF